VDFTPGTVQGHSIDDAQWQMCDAFARFHVISSDIEASDDHSGI
jgi:hypothetical protein